MERIIYVDHAATTPIKTEVIKEMLPYFEGKFGNPSTTYSVGRLAKAGVQKARSQVSKAIGCQEKEIYFTSGGSEADNLIIQGIARANRHKGNHIITTKIEHLAVLNSCRLLENEGFRVTYLNVLSNGMIDLKELEESITDDTILISVMFANNEIGTIEPIEKIGKIARQKNIIFHTDAVQAVGNVKINVEEYNIDALSLSAHKFYGPKGIGAVYIREGIAFLPIIHGGHQEKNKRAGTENVPAIVGLGKAIEMADNQICEYNIHLGKLRDLFVLRLSQGLYGIRINGDITNRLTGNINISIDGVDSQTLLLMLDMYGICISTGSACNSSTVEPSHVLKAIGLSDRAANSSIRISLGLENTVEDIICLSNTIIKVVTGLRTKKI